MPTRVRTMEITRKTPTPTPTDTISTMLGTEGICSASTTRSGSATVIITPSTKQMSMGMRRRFDFPICAPMPSPSGCMEISEPMVKRLIPKISVRVPKRNNTKIPDSNGAMETLSTNTMAKIGSTELIASFMALFR